MHTLTHSVTNLISQPSSKNDLTSQESVSGFIKSRRTAIRRILLALKLPLAPLAHADREHQENPGRDGGPGLYEGPRRRVEARDEALMEPFRPNVGSE